MATSKKITAVQFPNGETYAWDSVWADNVARGAAVDPAQSSSHVQKSQLSTTRARPR